jgi:hypothetical protein
VEHNHTIRKQIKPNGTKKNHEKYVKHGLKRKDGREEKQVKMCELNRRKYICTPKHGCGCFHSR